jgi:hypothetical protein
MGRLFTAAFTLALLTAAGCQQETRSGTMTTLQLPKLTDVDSAAWARLAQRRIFFGHQSVGRNIMDGVVDVLEANPRIKLWVIESKRLDGATAAGFYHARVGRNQFPVEKMDEFLAVADSAFSSGPFVGMMKLCYADMLPETDPQALFDAYQRHVVDLAARHPGLTLVHFTVPLTTIERTRGYWKKKLLGRFTERERNVIANRYNTLLRAAYEGRAPLFDLAKLESTRPDGSRTFFMRGADTVYTLVPEYTDDGGHFVVISRRMVAEQLLIFLARLPGS